MKAGEKKGIVYELFPFSSAFSAFWAARTIITDILRISFINSSTFFRESLPLSATSNSSIFG